MSFEKTTDPNRVYGKREEIPAATRFAEKHGFDLVIASKHENMFDKYDVTINQKKTDVKTTSSNHMITMTVINSKGENYFETSKSTHLLFELNKKISFFLSVENLYEWLKSNKKGLIPTQSGNGSKYITFYINELKDVKGVLVSSYENDSIIENLRIIAENLGYVLMKRMTSPLLLGKNRSEKGHTVRYSQLDKIFQDFGMAERCETGKKVLITTEEDKELIFSLNENNRAFCGVKNGANQYNDKITVDVKDIKLL